jgi:DNA-directed RNA polymerase specialized sigma24 family protein
MDYKNLSDSELITLLKQGDRNAFERIYRRYASDLYKYLGGRLDTSNDCDEILVDVFVSLWLGRYNLSVDLKSHLRALCRVRLALYACDNPSSTLSTDLKTLLYETREEKDIQKSKD